MCGIFGLAGPGFDMPQRERQARLLARRGPDGFGAHVDTRHQVYLAHCRLAVIDLSARGAQPMCNEDGSVWITFNGEIYGFAALRAELQACGHRFATATDTEVIIHAYEEWGIGCLARLNGMFAFALWDSRLGKIFLVRDRLGIKPLYYGCFSGTLAFASDTRALLGLPWVRRELEPSALASYLLYRYVAGEASIWRGISRLLPGHYLEYDLARHSGSTQRYWQLPLETQGWTAESALERFGELFEGSVWDCLVSDVPVGVFLSGGYDSSAVAAAAQGGAATTNTFSIGFAGWARDERAPAAETARLLHTAHHETVLGEEQFASIDEVVGAYDEPLADSSIFPTYLVSAFARRHATVALSGDGGDELFGGYTWYGHTVDCSARKRLAFLLEPLVRALGLHHSPWGRRCVTTEHYRLLNSPTFTLRDIRRLFPALPRDELPDEESYLYRQHLRRELTGYRRWQYVDLNTFLVDNNLTKVDRASMAHSLEVRVPFLDHRLVEFAFSLPQTLAVAEGRGKRLVGHWLMKNGLGAVLTRPKLGFSCPWQRFWPVSDMAGEIAHGQLVRSGILDAKALNAVLPVGVDAANDAQLMVLAILERWARKWI
jgi:asparagine synthase (glutamine-hydrolysing)